MKLLISFQNFAQIVIKDIKNKMEKDKIIELIDLCLDSKYHNKHTMAREIEKYLNNCDRGIRNNLMNKDVNIWEITIKGLNNFGECVVGGKASLTNLARESTEAPINELEFKRLWELIIKRYEDMK